MAYEPRGKVGTLVDAMRADIGRIWTSAEAAKVMDVSQGALSAHLDPAIRHGTLHRKLENGRCQYSLRPFLPPPPPAPAPQEPRIPEFRKDFKADQLPPQHGDETLAPVVKPDTRMSWPPASTPAPSASPAPDPEPKALEETEEVAFNAALWADGDLVIYGAQENDDGSVTLSTEKVRKLCRLLHGQGPEA